MSHVDLGFLEKTNTCLLKSNYFPSKVGGKPSWLSLNQLPSTEDLQCSKCNKQMIFLCQIYAPVEENNFCFHRTLFIFLCRNESCCSLNNNSNLVVWRSQLTRQNDFYPADPPVENPKNDFKLEDFVKICVVCGISATKHCSKCKIASYCSREHQIYDWKLRHKQICGTVNKENNKIDLLFEEFELVIEPEEVQVENNETVEESEQRRLKEYNDLVVDGKAGTMVDVSESELESHAVVDADKTFTQFRKKISFNPDQVLRYDRGGEPVWVASEPKPSEIPNCEYCNSPRQFEFQILPQLLYSLHENCLDWGTLAIYTCKESCNLGPTYKREYIFKQDFSNKTKI